MFFTVPHSHCVIVERLGTYNRTCTQGINFQLPVIESVRRLEGWGNQANKYGYQIEMTEQQSDTPSRQCHTRDNVTIEANASVYWRIFDPQRAVYAVDILPKSLTDVALNALRSSIGQLDLDEVLSERQKLNDKIGRELQKVFEGWGVNLLRVEIQELHTTDETANAMRRQMEAERGRRAAVLEAEGKAEAAIKTAEADRKATLLRADAQAKALHAIGEAEEAYLARLMKTLGPDAAAQVLVAQKMLEGYERIASNPAHKVFLPRDFSAMITADCDGRSSK